MTKRKGFTLIELMVVIMIVAILAAASIPMMRGRIDSAKWAEANATAGTIKSAVRVYFAEHGDSTGIIGDLGDGTIQNLLGFDEGDLTGTYFEPGDYAISVVDASGNATIVVTGDGLNGEPSGERTLDENGWTDTGE